jgi:hypothetical protein
MPPPIKLVPDAVQTSIGADLNTEQRRAVHASVLTRCRNGPALSDELMWLSPDR